MVGVMMSKWVADAFGRDGLYEEAILFNGYPYLDNKIEYNFTEKAGDVMSSWNLTVLTMHGHTIASLQQLLADTPYQGFPVVTNQQDMLLIGYISRTMLQDVLAKARHNPAVTNQTECHFSSALPLQRSAAGHVDLSCWLDQFPIQIAETMPLERVAELFRNLGLRYVLVMRYGQLVGVIKKKDILRYIASEVHGLRH